MISDDITFDQLLQDIDTQLEVLSAIAADNPILSEQLRVLNEAREQLLYQDMEIDHLFELIDPDDFHETLTIKQEPS